MAEPTPSGSQPRDNLPETEIPEQPLPLDYNYPDVGRKEDPEFPDEYVLETSTGIVPQTTLERRRSRASTFTAHKPPTDIEKAKESIEFVTFTIGDPEHPHNWSVFYRWYVTLVASGLVVCIAYGSSIVTGGLGLIQKQYNVSLEVAILTCSIMVCGFAVGPLIWSPLSEIIGRRPVYIISLSLYVIFNIPCALAPNIGCLLACRFLCGVFSSSGLSLAGGTIADIWRMEERGEAIAYFAAAPYCGPVIGPIVTGWINVGSGRLDLFFWTNMAFAGVVMIIIGLVPETYAPVILKRRAAKLRKETGNTNIITEQEQHKLTLRDIARTSLIRPITMIMTEPVLDLMCMYIVLIYSMLYAFFFAYPVIFGKLYNYNDGQIGLMFIPILIGASFSLMVTPAIEKNFRSICRKRASTPEDRLIAALIGAPFIPIAFFLLGATSFKHIIWVGPASSGIAFGFGMVLCYYSVNNYIIDSYQKYAASALAAKVFLRSGGGAAFPLFTTQMYDRLGLQWASWLLAFIGVGMVFIPYVFYIYGAKLRAKLNRD
ncbi:Major facilitator superfamily domain general substrate transporter [Penicillium atrosanguineum]|uniref:Major facilitator superfamily domain general substrate transporter n=1 Tax=Penicillium atrosanguineum TaxID=1132637 RepID=A0A9W9U0C6_9EURO|nr:Ubiquitin-conjugating enzyme E2 8 [Penicillium atrosanguineum]KAJ5125704.1 Major facilitator superfamily domain general substrate transporter [Penicillium atrosanguineum]KAJ5136468.1 Major facilitator superfamily domain general substrate transporter [Penicillium atrosanguineum]KAJ5292798.1 Ubiquitin-conjugating enzyme E2 8 [Penicillium atrosanguineum]KAJ5303162.1 Major facilitator superfamily domain general substrate transporter [Penicillium atrosanguineum]